MPSRFIKAIAEKIQDIKDERNKVSIAKAVMFAKKNRNCMIFLLDIKSDDMVAAYRELYMTARIKTRYLKRKTGLAKTIILGHGTKEKKKRDLIIFETFMGTFMKRIPEVIKTSEEELKSKKAEDNKQLTEKTHDQEKK